MKNIRLIAPVLASSLLLMGLSVPGCPGPELQQSIDALKSSEIDLKAKVNAADNSVKALKEEVAALKAEMTKVSETVVAQKTALEEMSKKVESLAAAGSKAKPAKKK
jgi:outer membrane murein-binding lipoprotein Lpp